MTERKHNPFLRYLWVWLATMAAVLLAIAGLNLVVDPYGAHPWASPAALDAYRPGVGGRIGKAELAARRPWEAVILGSSRALCGVDPADAAWGGRAVANLGLAGTRMAEMRGVFRFTVARTPPRQVLGLAEFHAFNAHARQFGDDFAYSRFNPALNWVDYFGGSLLSWRTTEASLRTLRWWRKGRVNDCGPLGFGTPHKLAAMGFRRALLALAERRGESSARPPYEISEDAIAALAEILQTCADRDIDLRLAIPPCHALELERIRADGQWPAFEEWKRRLTALVARHNRKTGSSVRLWDFTGYHGPLAEAVPPADAGDPQMQWHYDPGHFKPALGSRMLHTVLADKPSGDEALGVVLTPESVEGQLDRIRRARPAYVAAHADDVALMQRPAP